MNITPITDFFTNVKDKISNPFFGTLIFVWLVRNWDLVYSIFNFDKDYPLQNRISYIQAYINAKSIFEEVLINIGLTLILIVAGYLLIILTRSISTLAEFRIMPFLTQKIISNKVVFREQYEETSRERDEYSERYEQQRIQVRELSKQFDEISENFKKQSELVTMQTSEINKLEEERKLQTNQIEKQNREIEDLKKDSRLKEDKLLKRENDLDLARLLLKEYSKNFDYLLTDRGITLLLNNLDEFPQVDSIYQDLVQKNLINSFIEVYSFLERGGGAMSDRALNEMMHLGLVIGNQDEHIIAPIGKIIYKLIETLRSIGKLDN